LFDIWALEFGFRTEKYEKMKTARLNNQAQRAWQGRSGGFTLIEVLIALALFAIIAIVFAGGLSTASRAVLIADVRTRSESLARTQMESIKTQDYKDEDHLVNGEALYLKIPSADVPNGYEICSISRNLTVVKCNSSDGVIAVPWNSANGSRLEPLGADDGLQKITLVIKHDNIEVTRLEGYKLNR
jgi:prepilin-type N-terminal cleavage/methylation domain-containing protein